MSEFASMLASFKQNAAASSSSSQSKSRNSTTTATNQNNDQQTRKRTHSTSSNNVRHTPYFPHMHSDRRKKGDFELSFLVIGAQKAGTSWLHTLLQKCNHLSLPREQKEVHFWDWHIRKGFDWYIRQFNFPQHRSGHRALDRGHSSETNNKPLLYGEITPCYVVLPPPTISEIKKCFPRMKIIFVARDMVDRAWSAMIMELRDQTMGLNPGEFAKGAMPGGSKQPSEGSSSKRAKMGTDTTKMSVAQQRRLKQQSSPSAQPDSYYLERLRSETHTSRSDYATHLKNWFTHFPSKNILIVDYRDIENDPRDVLQKIVMHIGLEERDASAYVQQLSEEDVQQRVNAATNTNLKSGEGDSTTTEQKAATSSSSQHTLSQRPQLRKQFEKYLRPYATKFNVLLEKEGYSWRLNDY